MNIPPRGSSAASPSRGNGSPSQPPPGRAINSNNNDTDGPADAAAPPSLYPPPIQPATSSAGVDALDTASLHPPPTPGDHNGAPDRFVRGDGDYLSARRRPSVRLRRVSSSNRSTNSQASSGVPARKPLPSQAFPSDGFGGQTRPRTVSEPERAYRQSAAVGSGARGTMASERDSGPACAMPRLTEEGARPSPGDLAAAGSSGDGLQRTMTAPEDRRLGDESGDESASTRTGHRRLRRTTAMFGFRHQRDNEQHHDRHRRLSRRDTARTADECDDELVDLLDVVDPEVSTLSTLTNIQNSLFIPQLGHWVNRRPTYTFDDGLPPPEPYAPGPHIPIPPTVEPFPPLPDEERPLPPLPIDEEEPSVPPTELRRAPTATSITSRISDSRFAVLPHGERLDGWSREEKNELNDQVRHMLHSRRSRMKRSLKGFGQYVRRPLGFLVTLYATLITLFGLAWVLFLIGWIYVGDEQVYAIHVIDSVLVALFAIMGDGLAPFRAVDTYHMIFVAHYSRKTWKLREKKGLPELENKNDIPTKRFWISRPLKVDTTVPIEDLEKFASPTNPQAIYRTPQGPVVASNPNVGSGTNSGTKVNTPGAASPDAASPNTNSSNTLTMQNMTSQHDGLTDFAHPDDDIEAAKGEQANVSVLSAKEQYRLQHHQKKLSRSHTFYQPHETETHYAFPIVYLIVIVVLLDLHSCLQISLGATTWGIDYRHRHFAITTVILILSITCNVTAGILISLGDKKTRKKDVSKLLERRELTHLAMKVVEKERKKKATETRRQGRDVGGGAAHGGRETTTTTTTMATRGPGDKRSWMLPGLGDVDETGESPQSQGGPAPPRTSGLDSGPPKAPTGASSQGGGKERKKLQKGDTWSNRRKQKRESVAYKT